MSLCRYGFIYLIMVLGQWCDVSCCCCCLWSKQQHTYSILREREKASLTDHKTIFWHNVGEKSAQRMIGLLWLLPVWPDLAKFHTLVLKFLSAWMAFSGCWIGRFSSGLIWMWIYCKITKWICLNLPSAATGSSPKHTNFAFINLLKCVMWKRRK